MIKYLIVLLAVLACNSYSQNLSLYGKVKDTEGRALPGVNVTIQGLNRGDAAGSDGSYEIKGLVKGNYVVRFSMIGFSEIKKEVILLANTKLDAVLTTEAYKTEQVIVSASKHEQILLNLPVSADLLENKELLRYNYTNIRDAFKYVSGINLVDDQMSIRGSSGYSRGAGARVLVAIDGIPFYTGDTGEIIWEAMSRK
jgi:outer membrane receptor for ferrienterochelin and colicins